MTQEEMSKNARIFSENWRGKGDEKQETSRFWIGLLGEVLGVLNPQNYIEFEKRVKLSHTSFIDAYIPETKVLIEQKGIKIDLKKAYEQSDGTVLTPFEQAKRYVNDMKASEKPRWIVVSNFAEADVYDLENPQNPPEVIYLKDLEKDFYRLEFLVDRKNENIRREEEISIAAGRLVGKMYDALIKEYINPTTESLRSLNILCVRLVFCFYAEDAGLFETRTSFEDYIKSFNLPNVRKGLIALFKALDTKLDSRDKYDESLKPFPYVNGGLFHDENIEIPNFTQEIVDVLVNDCAVFNWSEISPTIFGAVFESTLNPETRRKGGMHYTSIQNIHKVIDPLFLDELNKEFDEIMGDEKSHNGSHAELADFRSRPRFDSASASIKQIPKQVRNDTSLKKRTAALLNFQEKLGKLTFLDPACGSGNFLTETYLSLRRLENNVISALNKGEKVLGFDEFIKVKISQFYGIEINDFAVTVAKTALWIAESQMVSETEKILGQQIDFLPLKTNAFIVEGNALRMNWAFVGKRNEDLGMSHNISELPLFSETADSSRLTPNHYDYIMGNPPFVGYAYQSKTQKDDLHSVSKNIANNIDYVAGWYFKAARLIQNTNTKCAFVSTNSITQGEQVALIWKPLFENYHIKIDFAWRTFRWDSESTEKAHVHCVIVGFSFDGHSELDSESANEMLKISADDNGSPQVQHDKKFIIDKTGEKHFANHINGYLLDAPDIFIEKNAKPICDVQEMIKGSIPVDGGNLIIKQSEYDEFVKREPLSKKFIKPFIGSEEFINNKKRWCLWLVDAEPNELRKMPFVMERIKKVKEMRLSSKKETTKKFADYPTRFMEIRQPKADYLAVPEVSSESREYIPLAFLKHDVIISNKLYSIQNATVYHFGVLTSSVHMAWMRAVCGRLEMRYSYSNTIVYNNFPWCKPTEEQKEKISKTAQNILDARAKFPNASLADLYNPLTMPPELRKAHEANDKAVMQTYGFDKNASESEIVAELFKMYEKLAKKQ